MHEDELDSWDKILGFKAIELGYKIELYEYHHDEIGEILDVKKFYDQFLDEHEELMNEFFFERAESTDSACWFLIKKYLCFTDSNSCSIYTAHMNTLQG